jgi:hypothetical protein
MGQLERRRDVRLRRDVGPVPVETGSQGPLASSSRIDRIGVGMSCPGARKLAQSWSESQCSAMPAKRNRSMYHDFSCCS